MLFCSSSAEAIAHLRLLWPSLPHALQRFRRLAFGGARAFRSACALTSAAVSAGVGDGRGSASLGITGSDSGISCTNAVSGEARSEPCINERVSSSSDNGQRVTDDCLRPRVQEGCWVARDFEPTPQVKSMPLILMLPPKVTQTASFCVY